MVPPRKGRVERGAVNKDVKTTQREWIGVEPPTTCTRQEHLLMLQKHQEEGDPERRVCVDEFWAFELWHTALGFGRPCVYALILCFSKLTHIDLRCLRQLTFDRRTTEEANIVKTKDSVPS